MKSCAAIRYMLLPLVARKANQELLKTNTFYRLKHSPCSDLGIEFCKVDFSKDKINLKNDFYLLHLHLY